MGKASSAKAARRLTPRSAQGPARTALLTPGRTLVIGLATAVSVAAVLIAVSAAGTGTSSKTSAATVNGVLATNALFRGIPQHANVLGDLKAPATLVEFAEPQCPICGAWARETLPTIVRDYVRTGKLKLVFRGISFIQPSSDSERALRTLAAAGAQGRQFQLLDLLYRNQGEEVSGWITDGTLRSLGAVVRGLDVERMMAERSSNTAKLWIESSARAATQVMGGHLRTPTFLAGPSGGRLAVMPLSSAGQLGPRGFSRLLEQTLSR
jgi:protein-disulfide isomerase